MFFLRVLDPVANIDAFGAAVRLTMRHRGLLAAMTRRELTDRYTGQVLGAAWAILSPLLTMLIYVLVFTFIFRGRLGEVTDPTAFTAYALAGLAPWVAFSEGLSRTVGAVTGNANLVKQIVFPLEVLPLKVVLATLPTLLMGLTCAVIAAAVSGLADPLRLLLELPMAILFYLLFVAGVGLLMSAFGVFLRDIKDIIAFLLGVGMFLNPIIYPPGSAPKWLEASFAVNPIANMIFCFHDAITGPVDLGHRGWIVFPLTALVTFALGWRTFRLLKPGFGNAL